MRPEVKDTWDKIEKLVLDQIEKLEKVRKLDTTEPDDKTLDATTQIS